MRASDHTLALEIISIGYIWFLEYTGIIPEHLKACLRYEYKLYYL